ncbi:MAG: DUF192 domain-containing protein [Phycisphaerae bacterium]
MNLPRSRRLVLLMNPILASLALSGCNGFSSGVPRGSSERNDLAKLATASVEITNHAGQKHAFRVWIARAEHEKSLGLMNVSASELATDQGMLFLFDYDAPLGFWMRNTIIPLDIAYVRSDGTIVRTLTMQPLVESTYPSIEPARFALEVNAGEFARRNIAAGDLLKIPPDVLNPPH